MTSASELFYTRRFRSFRSPEPALRPSPAELDRDRERDRDREHYLNHHRPPRRQHRHRLHSHDCGSPRQFLHGGAAHGGRHLCDRGGLQTEIGTSESSLGSNSTNEISSRNSRLRLSTSDRLPGAVIQARARLLERLRGISLTGSRQSTSSSGISWDEFVVSDDFRVVDLGDWETDAFEVPEPGPSFLDSIPRADRSPSFHEQEEKKPPGLTWEAINMLPQEAFKDLSGGTNAASKASSECSICLDKFWEGDTLIRLACGHLFHPECLTPWVQTCGDCPYCRSRIVVNPTAEKRLSGVTH